MCLKVRNIRGNWGMVENEKFRCVFRQLGSFYKVFLAFLLAFCFFLVGSVDAQNPTIVFGASTTIGGRAVLDATTEVQDVSTVIDVNLKFSKPMDLQSIKNSVLKLDDITSGVTQPEFSFKLDGSDGLSNQYLIVDLVADGGVSNSMLRIRTKTNAQGRPLFILVPNHRYQLKFDAAYYPHDTNANPLDQGNATFTFRTGTRPGIMFAASSSDLSKTVIGGRSVLDATTEVQDVSTVIDVNLKFSKPMDLQSIKNAVLKLDDLSDANQVEFSFKLDGSSPNPLILLTFLHTVLFPLF